MADVVLDSITKRYAGGALALRDLSFRVDDGTCLVLLGPSGSGKTTALRIVAGLEAPTSGTVRLDDREATRLSPRERNVAMVTQDFALYPHLTVRTNMELALRLRRVERSEARARVEQTALRLGLGDVLDRRPATLSGGEQQRAALGKALVRRPRCLLLDEPLSNVDPDARHRIRAEIRTLRETLPVTTIHVTHDQEEALTLADRIGVLRAGALRQVDTPRAVYATPADRFVAGFVGRLPMNFVEGRIEGAGDGASFVGDRGLRVRIGAGASRPAPGTPVVLGVRPEHVRRATGGDDPAHVVHVTVDLVEPLGDRTVAHGAEAGGTALRACVDDGAGCAKGATIGLHVDPGRIHLFSPGPDGRRLA